MPRLAVRPLTEADVPHVVDYLIHASAEDRQRMGLDHVPPREELERRYLAACATPEAEASSFMLTWLVDERPIGFSSLKNIKRGESGAMHLHIWDRELRGQGLGSSLFCLSALEFYRRFELRSVVCEPRAANPMPNRMLKKIGFPLVETFVGASSELSAVCELNRYDVQRELAEAYVQALASRA